MTKATSASAIKYFVNELSQGQVVTLRQVWDYVTSQGIDKVEAQVYADASVLASNGYINRGNEKRTYVQVSPKNKPDKRSKEIKDVEPPERLPKTRKTKTAIHTNEEVSSALEAVLGKPINRPLDSRWATVLLGEWSAEYILQRAEQQIGSKPTAWFMFMVGENTAVGIQ